MPESKKKKPARNPAPRGYEAQTETLLDGLRVEAADAARPARKLPAGPLREQQSVIEKLIDYLKTTE